MPDSTLLLPVWDAVKTAPWLAYIFFVQNLFHLALPPAIAPTWALGIEEQYFLVCPPVEAVVGAGPVLGCGAAVAGAEVGAAAGAHAARITTARVSSAAIQSERGILGDIVFFSFSFLRVIAS